MKSFSEKKTFSESVSNFIEMLRNIMEIDVIYATHGKKLFKKWNYHLAHRMNWFYDLNLKNINLVRLSNSLTAIPLK